MSSPVFHEILHTPHRLRICVMLSQVEQVEFSLLRDTLEVADSVLSKLLKVLVDAGYVTLSKPAGQGGRRRTWAGLTRSGRTAVSEHLAALEQMIQTTQATAANWNQ